MNSIRLLAAMALFGAAMAPAAAQSAAPPASSTAAAPEQTMPGTAPSTNLDQKSGSLSRKLGDTNGVIAPSGDVDPDMHVGTPKTGTMPVIKPGQTGEGVAK